MDPTHEPQKTYKRETGWFAGGVLIALIIAALLGVDNAMQLVELLVLPVIGLNVGTLGLDSLAKQFSFGKKY